MDIIQLLDELCDGKVGEVGKLGEFGHKDKLLDVIMPETPSVATTERSLERLRYDLEDICRHGGHAMTITFTDKNLLTYTECYLLGQVNNVCKRQKGLIRYIFINDYSSNGRFHLHGVILVKDIAVITKLRKKLRKFGMTKCKLIDDSPKWTRYCVQQYLPEGKHELMVKRSKLMYIIK